VVGDGTLWRISPQFHYYWGPFGLLGEYVLSSQTLRQAGGGETGGQGGTVQNHGWQVAASYLLTGERNSYRAVTPEHPVTFGTGSQWGAWELAARVGGIHIDDRAFPVFADPLVSAWSALSWGIGLNWHLNRNVKLQLNYEHTDFDGGEDNPVNARDESLFSTRVQITY
jgi:phosphate-selective porin OprO/OprP